MGVMWLLGDAESRGSSWLALAAWHQAQKRVLVHWLARGIRYVMVQQHLSSPAFLDAEIGNLSGEAKPCGLRHLRLIEFIRSC